MNNDKIEITKCGRGISIIVVIIILLGTLFPLFGSATQASAMETSEITTEGATNPESAVGQILVYGTLRYKDRDISGNETPNSPLPLRFARIDIMHSMGGGSKIGETETDEFGYFNWSYNSNEWPPGDYYAIVYAYNQYASVKDIEHPLNTIFENYSDITTIPEGSEGQSFEISFSYLDHQAWNILDSVTEAAEWVKTRTGGWTRSRIDVNYPKAKSEFKYLWGTNVDWINIATDDGWIDHIIYHEYGHAIMYVLYSRDVPNTISPHIERNEYTPQHALGEGWAEFLQQTVGGGSCWHRWDWTRTKSNLYLEYGGDPTTRDGPYSPNRLSELRDYHDNVLCDGLPFGDAYRWKTARKYVDDDGNFIGYYDDDENGYPDHDNNGNGIVDYDSIEANVAGILWDIYDDPWTYDYYYPYYYAPYDDDGLALGFGPIWDVMRFRTPHTIYEFWDGWFTNYGTGDSYAARTTANSRHWIKAIYFNHGIDPGSSNIDSAYRLPQNAPLVTDFQITSTGPYNDNKWIDYKLKLSDEPGDQNFLRVRLEYLDTATNKWVQFHEVENKNMPIVDGYYTYNVHVNALGDGTWTVRAVVDDGYPTCQRRLFSLGDSYIPG